MYKLERVDFSKLSLKVLPRLENALDLGIATVNYPSDRSVKLYFHGTIAATPELNEETLSFKFRPELGDLPKLVQLEEILLKGSYSEKLCSCLDKEGIEIRNFEFRPTLDNDGYLRIKLKSDNKKWKFYSNETITESNMETLFVQAKPITVAMTCGFYFSSSSDRYGLFFTLKDLIFDNKETPVTAEVKKFLKKEKVSKK